jgi:hypothetical protein
MPTTSLRDFDENVRLHASEAIMERRTNMHGSIRVYPPAVDPSEWGEHGWLLTTEGTSSCPAISARIKAEAVAFCYDRPHLLENHHRFS